MCKLGALKYSSGAAEQKSTAGGRVQKWTGQVPWCGVGLCVDKSRRREIYYCNLTLYVASHLYIKETKDLFNTKRTARTKKLILNLFNSIY